LNPSDTTHGQVVSVDRASFMGFVQFRAQSLADNAGQELDNLSTDALADIIAQYIQEEAPYF
jgi:hypothetical protein